MISKVGEGIETDDARGLRVILAIKEEQFDVRGAPGKEAEIDAVRKDSGTQRTAFPGLLSSVHCERLVWFERDLIPV
jgi:hypothetical protein